MSGWPKHPMVYEINTAVWLGELGKEAGSPVTLATVPARSGTASPFSDAKPSG